MLAERAPGQPDRGLALTDPGDAKQLLTLLAQAQVELLNDDRVRHAV